MNTTPRFLVVIGASAGGLNALAEMVQHLEPDTDTAYCIVLHLSRKSVGDFVVHRLKQVTNLTCQMGQEGMPITTGHIYVARPNLHMMVKNDKIILGAGPEENRWRPDHRVGYVIHTNIPDFMEYGCFLIKCFIK